MNSHILRESIAGMEGQDLQMDVATVFRSIFCSCDIDGTDLVPVSKLIEFIKPFMMEDLNALEDLRLSLDPDCKDTPVNSDRFYEVMGNWSKKIAAGSSDEENEFNRSPSQLHVIEDKELPYTHSTPRASLGDKLLRCKDLLNLSNVSGYSLSTSRLDTTNPADADKTVLEEEIKKLEHQLSKTSNELVMTKQQLSISEEQNDTLQADLERLNRRLHAEQQVIEHLHKDKQFSEELREELNSCKKVMEQLKKKLSQSEKDSLYFKDLIDELEQEKTKLDKKNEFLSKHNQELCKEIFDIKTEMDVKEQQVNDIKNVYDELKAKYTEQKDFVDQLREENGILIHQRTTLEKALKTKASLDVQSYSTLDVREEKQDSSEEDLYWKLEHVTENNGEGSPKGTNESLACEMQYADPTKLSDTYHTALFERDEQIVDLEDELEKAKSNLKEMEYQKNDVVSKLLQQRESNDELLQANFVLTTNVESNNGKIETLKMRLAQLEKNGVISENDETDLDDLKIKLQMSEKQLRENDKKLTLLQKDNSDFKERFKEMQEIMRDLGQTSAEKVAYEGQVKTLKEINENLEVQVKTLTLTLTRLKEEIKMQKVAKQQLEEANFILTNNLEQKKVENENLLQRLGAAEQELVGLQDQNNNNKLKIEFAENIKLKDEELQKFKDKLDEKIKNCVEAEKNIVVKEKKIQDLLVKYSSKSRSFVEMENTLKAVNQINNKLQDEIKILKAGKIDEAETLMHGKIEAVTSEVQQHIDKKNLVTDELRALNRKMENLLNESQSDLKEKVNQILDMRNELCRDISVKNELWQKMQTLQSDVDDVKNQNEELKIEYNSLLGIYDVEVIKNSKLNKQISELISEKENYFSKYKEIKEEFDIVIKKLTTEQQKNEELNKDISKYKEKVNKMEVRNTDSLKKLSELDKKCTDQAKLHNELFDKNQTINEELALLKQDYDSKLQKLHEISSVLENLKTVLKGKEEQISQTEVNNKQQLDNLLKIKEEKDKINSDLKNEVDKSKRLAEDLTQKNVDLNKAVFTYEEIINNMEAKNKDLVDELSELGKKNCNRHEKVLQELDETNKKISHEVSLLKQDNESLKTVVKTTEDQINQKEAENMQLLKDILKIKQEKDELYSDLQNEIKNIKMLTEDLSQKISENELLTLNLLKETNANRLLMEKITQIEQEKERLIIELNKNKIAKDVNEKWQEEVTKNKSLFATFALVKKEKECLSIEIKELESLLKISEGINSKKQNELKDLQKAHAELQINFKNQTESLKKSELLLQIKQKELYENSTERNRLKKENAKMRSSLDNANDDIKNIKEELLTTRQELDNKQQKNESLNLSKSDTSTCSLNIEKDKKKSYSKQEITIERLKEKIECLEVTLKEEIQKKIDLQNQLAQKESRILSNTENFNTRVEKLQEQLSKQEEKFERLLGEKDKLQRSICKSDDCKKEELRELEDRIRATVICDMEMKALDKEGGRGDDGICVKSEGKSINKFTLCASKLNKSRPASPDSPSLDIETLIEVPSLDFTGLADEVLDDLDLTEGSPRKKLDREETEKKVTELTLRLLIHSNNVTDRIEKQTEAYRCQYEGLLTLVNDISFRLRDHICIGTSEPIKPVYVLLEEIKKKLKEVVQSAGQVGILVYEDRMKKCWNFVTNYMAMIKQENDSLNSSLRSESTTGLIRRRVKKSIHDRENLYDEDIVQHSRRCGPSTRLIVASLFLVAFAITISLLIHLNCRMTASENQYCPLDGIITRQIIGTPPM